MVSRTGMVDIPACKPPKAAICGASDVLLASHNSFKELAETKQRAGSFNVATTKDTASINVGLLRGRLVNHDEYVPNKDIFKLFGTAKVKKSLPINCIIVRLTRSTPDDAICCRTAAENNRDKAVLVSGGTASWTLIIQCKAASTA